jgi:hypothetical protein
MGLDSVRYVITQACHAACRSRSDVFPRPSIRPNQPQSTPLSSPQSAAQVSEWHGQSILCFLSFSGCGSSGESRKEMKTELACYRMAGIESNFLLLLYKALLVYFRHTFVYTQILFSVLFSRKLRHWKILSKSI